MTQFVVMRPGRNQTEYLDDQGAWTRFRVMRLVFLSRESADLAKRRHGGYVVPETVTAEAGEAAMRAFRSRGTLAGEEGR